MENRCPVAPNFRLQQPAQQPATVTRRKHSSQTNSQHPAFSRLQLTAGSLTTEQAKVKTPVGCIMIYIYIYTSVTTVVDGILHTYTYNIYIYIYICDYVGVRVYSLSYKSSWSYQAQSALVSRRGIDYSRCAAFTMESSKRFCFDM